MKKRALAILLVLVMVTAGLFAAPTVTVPGAVTATLKANIGEYLAHGFNIAGTKYQPTVTVEDAFGATAPSFRYGYKTNAAGTFVFKMAVGNFTNSTVAGTVKIASVSSDKGTSYAGGFYTIFNDYSATITSAERYDEALITITPARTANIGSVDHTGAGGNIVAAETVEGGSAGAYTATLTFSISAS